MGRRSLAAERRRHIVAVTIDCLVEHGFSGSTLDRIADLAGMARGHIRHYVGNRDELLTTAATVFYFGEDMIDERDARTAAAHAPLLPSSATVPEALDYLFGEFAAPSAENPAAYAFLEAGRSMPSVHEITLLAYNDMQRALERILQKEHPDTDDERIRRVAYAVLSISLGNMFMLDLQMSDQRLIDGRAAAQDSIRALSDSVSSATA